MPFTMLEEEESAHKNDALEYMRLTSCTPNLERLQRIGVVFDFIQDKATYAYTSTHIAARAEDSFHLSRRRSQNCMDEKELQKSLHIVR